ncbi:APC family permease [Planctomicrobium sp. SH661]|uniref:APC family permease n=1 Tax=Planctomicrobium sp. SH661 TaxID=3448124 RepID=UPI003F5B5774
MSAVPTLNSSTNSTAPLRREVGLLGAVMMGLGSIVGTGVFVSIAVATEAAGPSVILAIGVAALVAACNGLSSAQLAAAHPVSGGTYEYGYRWLTPSMGFLAGWMFLCAKSASAATAALGFSGYLLNWINPDFQSWRVPLAAATVIVMTLLVMSGIRRSSRTNTVIVCVTIFTLAVFIVAGFPAAISRGTSHLKPFFAPVSPDTLPGAGFLRGCALMFVAYTGYGRIATMAEEVSSPRRTIPTAIMVTLLISMILYVAVGTVGVAAVGADIMASSVAGQSAPLVLIAKNFNTTSVAGIVSAGAMTAMLGVLLNLLLGLSRVVLAMARRGDLPRALASVHERTSSPARAILTVGVVTLALVLSGDTRLTWSFSAFTVLVYYAITNLAALRVSSEDRRYPVLIPCIGLSACLILAFCVDPRVWGSGLGVIAIGAVCHRIARRQTGWNT